MKVAFALAALSLAVIATGCTGHRAAATVRPCSVDLVHPSLYGGDLVADMPDGSIVVGTTYENDATVSLALKRVDSSCRPVRSWGVNGTAIVGRGVNTGTFGQFEGSIDLIAPGPHGRLLIGGNLGRRELVGQLLPNGTLDRAFGHGGWIRIDVHDPLSAEMGPPGPLATSFALAPDGTLYVGGDDQSAHCCAQDFVTKLTAAGLPDPSFGNAGSVIVPNIAGSYVTELVPAKDGSVYVFVEYEQSGSSDPQLIRLEPDGSLDARFDTAAAHAIRRATPRDFRLTPTLLPGPRNGIILVGGRDKPFPLAVGHEVSGGAVLVVSSDGGLVRERRFPATQDGFDNPLATRLPSGDIVVAGELYDKHYRLATVIVRSFSSTASPRWTRTISRASLAGSLTVDGLVSRPGGGVWLVTNSRTSLELTPVH